MKLGNCTGDDAKSKGPPGKRFPSKGGRDDDKSGSEVNSKKQTGEGS